METSSRAIRLLRAMNFLTTKPTFDGAVLKKLQSASNGSIKGSFIVDVSMCNIGGTLHGGYIASVIDVLSFYTRLSNPDGRLSWTTSVNVSFINSANEGEKVNVETKSLKIGSFGVVETYFHNEKDNNSLQIAKRTHKPWARIILSNRKLRNRLNRFELAIKLGSASLARFYRKNKRNLKKEQRKNYLPVGRTMVSSTEKTVLKSKRAGEDIVLYTKRFKLH